MASQLSRTARNMFYRLVKVVVIISVVKLYPLYASFVTFLLHFCELRQNTQVRFYPRIKTKTLGLNQFIYLLLKIFDIEVRRNHAYLHRFLSIFTNLFFIVCKDSPSSTSIGINVYGVISFYAFFLYNIK